MRFKYAQWLNVKVFQGLATEVLIQSEKSSPRFWVGTTGKMIPTADSSLSYPDILNMSPSQLLTLPSNAGCVLLLYSNSA